MQNIYLIQHFTVVYCILQPIIIIIIIIIRGSIEFSISVYNSINEYTLNHTHTHIKINNKLYIIYYTMGNSPSTALTLSYYSDELQKRVVPCTQSDFWSMIFTTAQNHTEIYEFCSNHTLQAIYNKQPQNIINFLRVLLSQLYSNINIVRPLCYIPTTKLPNRIRSADIIKLNHCVAMLTRILVWLGEFHGQHPDTVNSILWSTEVIDQHNQSIIDIRYAVIQAEYVERVNANIAQINSINKPLAAPPSGTSGSVHQSIDQQHNVVLASEQMNQNQNNTNNTSSMDTTSIQSAPQQYQSSSSILGSTLGECVISLMYELLFLETYTIDIHNKKQQLYQGVFIHRQYEASVIPAGAYYPSTTVGWSYLDPNRHIVLKCLLVACSYSIYVDPTQYKYTDNKFLQYITSEKQILAPTLYYSLISTILSYNPNNQYLPYTHNMSKVYENREKLVDLSLQLLLVLLDYRNLDEITVDTQVDQSMSTLPLPPPISDELKQRGVSLHSNNMNISSTIPPYDNIYRRLMFGVTTDNKILVALYHQLTNLLNNNLYADTTLMNNSQKKIDCYQEVTCLIWKLIDEHPTFMNIVLHGVNNDNNSSTAAVAGAPTTPDNPSGSTSTSTTSVAPAADDTSPIDILELIHPLLYILHKTRYDSSKQGLMYTCVFILLKLSGEREFGVSLNTQLNSLTNKSGYIVTKLPINTMVSNNRNDTLKSDATYADLLIIVCTQLILQSNSHLDALLKVILTMLCNISPYITTLQLLSSTKLLELFELFNTQSFLIQNSTNYQYIILLLDMFNNIIQYQYHGHSNLVYSVIRRAKLFWSLNISSNYSVNQFNTTNSPANMFINHGNDEPNQSNNTDNNNHNNHSIHHNGNQQWKSELPLEPIYRLLEFFVPKIDKLFKEYPKLDEQGVLNLIRKTTLVGVLPKPHSLLVRRYIPNMYTAQWFTTYTWGILYVRNSIPLSLWNGQYIKMFNVTLPNNNNTTSSTVPSEQVSESTTPTNHSLQHPTALQLTKQQRQIDDIDADNNDSSNDDGTRNPGTRPTGVQLSKQLRGLNDTATNTIDNLLPRTTIPPLHSQASNVSTTSIYALSDTFDDSAQQNTTSTSSNTSELPSASSISTDHPVITTPPINGISEMAIKEHELEHTDNEPIRASNLEDVDDIQGNVSLQ